MAVAQPNDYSEQTLVCIQNCQDCHRACLQTLAYCLRQGGRHAEGDPLRLLMDCADICLTSAAFMIRGSDLHAHTCAACAEVCRRCAEECDRMSDDLRMQALADTCRHCAESCRSMAAGHAGGTGDGVAKVARGAARAIRQAGATAAPVMTRRKTK